MKNDLNGDLRETELGALPAEWRIVRLGDFIEKPEYGLTASAVQNASGPRFVRITDIQDGQINWDDVPSCECSKKEIAKFALTEGDILFARIGATTGKTLFVRHCPTAVFASYLIRVKARSSLNSEFLSFFTNSKEYWSQIDSSKGGRLKQGVNIPILTNLIVPFPPLPEQRAIARVLSTLQRAIETQDNLIAAARELKKSLMRQLFTRGLGQGMRDDSLRLSGGMKETEIGVMPEHWEVVIFGELLNRKVLFARNGFPCGNHNNKNLGIPHLRPFNIDNEGRIVLDILKYIETKQDVSKYVLRDGDVIFNNTNSEELVGKTGYWQRDGNFVLSNHMTILRILQTGFIDGIYLSKFFQKRWGDGYFTGICRRHVNQASISLARLHQIPIALPPIAEQREIARILATVDKKIETEEKRKAALQALFKTMLEQLMTGKIRVREEGGGMKEEG